MHRYRITFTDGAQLVVEAQDGTEAKAAARQQRGVDGRSVLKSAYPIARVEPFDAADAGAPARY